MRCPRLGTAIPQLAVVAPLVAFAIDGTAVPIPDGTEQLLQWASWVILAAVATSIALDTRFARVVSAALMIVWWGGLIASLLLLDSPRTSAFGILALSALPVTIAFTWGHAWGLHDVTERMERS
jgi:hypothetical protein